MVGKVGNKVEAVVKIFDMVAGPLVSKEASWMFHQHPHSCIWLVTPVTMGNHMLDALLYIGDIWRCCLMGILVGDV